MFDWIFRNKKNRSNKEKISEGSSPKLETKENKQQIDEEPEGLLGCKTGIAPDGKIVNVRAQSSLGVPTLETFDRETKKRTKVRYTK